MNVVIIGAGNVATVLGRLMKGAGYQIVQVISRKMDTAQILADELHCGATNNFEAIDKTASLYIVAMSDAALNDLKENINVGDKVIVHTAGSVSKEVLKDVSTNYGVLYPLQSLRKENTGIHLNIPVLIDANNAYTLNVIETLANSIASPVMMANDEYRQKIHVAAVVVSNFVNHLYSLAYDFCSKENLDFKILLPLIEETASRLHQHSPNEMQTGPAVRKDIITLDKHLRLLTAHPRLRNIYLKITDSIMNS
jgi:predicted short-subunit dehydrogenase-like oxidoreductase (DUF2520 family)